jgi:hypothetical protein
LRWSSRSGSGVLNLVCVLSGDLGVYERDMAMFFYLVRVYRRFWRTGSWFLV